MSASATARRGEGRSDGSEHKSTFVERTLAPSVAGSVFVNAGRDRQTTLAARPAGARLPGRTDRSSSTSGRPLFTETVFSRPSKLKLIDTAHGHGTTLSSMSRADMLSRFGPSPR
jgi:predicted ABC-type ATPase